MKVKTMHCSVYSNATLNTIIGGFRKLCCLQAALGWDYQAELSKHGSQKDAAKGFGGKYGVQKDRQDEV